MTQAERDRRIEEIRAMRVNVVVRDEPGHMRIVKNDPDVEFLLAEIDRLKQAYELK